MNIKKFRRQFPSLAHFYWRASQGDSDALFLLARYDHCRGAYKAALRKYHDGAQSGHATSMYYMGMKNFQEGNPSSYLKAVQKFIVVANLGEKHSREEYARSGISNFEPYFSVVAESAYMVGYIHEYGLGVKKKHAKGPRLL